MTVMKRNSSSRRVSMSAQIGAKQIPLARRSAILASVFRLANGTLGRSPAGVTIRASDSKGRSMVARAKR